MKKSELKQIIREEVGKVLNESITSSLENLEQSVRDELRINSADPVYSNPAIRKKWMDKVSSGIKQLGGADVIKSKWKSISSELENDNYHQLRLFLSLSLKLDKGAVEHYTHMAMDKSSRDRAALKDFLAYTIK